MPNPVDTEAALSEDELEAVAGGEFLATAAWVIAGIAATSGIIAAGITIGRNSS